MHDTDDWYESEQHTTEFPLFRSIIVGWLIALTVLGVRLHQETWSYVGTSLEERTRLAQEIQAERQRTDSIVSALNRALGGR